MAETTTETVTENDSDFVPNAEGVAYTSETVGSSATPDKLATIAPGAATGCRKEAVARVRIVPGTGVWTVNGKPLEEYLPNKLHQQIAKEAFRCPPPGCRPIAQPDRRRSQPPGPQEGRTPHARLAHQGAQEGWSQEGT